MFKTLLNCFENENEKMKIGFKYLLQKKIFSDLNQKNNNNKNKKKLDTFI